MKILKNTIICFLISLISSCSLKKQKPLQPHEITTSWAEMTLFITKNTPANSPTYSSRCLGYVGLTMYESVVNGYLNYQSLEGQLNGLRNLPKPEKGKKYDWQLTLNAGQATILKSIYNQTSDINKAKIDSLETLILEQISSKIQDTLVISRSVNFGKAIAQQIFEWSKSDGGHRSYLKNFDKKMKYPSFLGCWKPPLYAQSFSHYPLQPHWGENRTFLVNNDQLKDPKFIVCDTNKNSTYYKQFVEVYKKQKILTQEEKEIAIWWSDDPDETFTPPGHSYYLATLAIKKTKPDLLKCAETYARVGMAVADAFRDCWKWKYQFFSERPNTFIPEHIDRQWDSFWPDPPFPAFPSGHAIQAAAMATVLENLYGKSFKFTDSAHVGRKRDEQRNADFKARHFNSFWEVATETANSRFYGGIHCPQDNEAGLEKGKEIGKNVNGLKWKR